MPRPHALILPELLACLAGAAVALTTLGLVTSEPPIERADTPPAEHRDQAKPPESLSNQLQRKINAARAYFIGHDKPVSQPICLLAETVAADDGSTTGLAWAVPEAGNICPNIKGQHIVLLVHGLDEAGPIWDELTPELLKAKHTVVRFDYPNDQAIADSADALGKVLVELRSRGVESLDIVAHSMGGLVARDVLTRDTYYAGDARGVASAEKPLPRISRFIMLGTPNQGSPLARLQPLLEFREQIMRAADGSAADGSGVLLSNSDGRGEAGRDLAPHSAFLNDLNSRPLPTNVKITCIVASIAPEDTRKWLDDLSTTDFGEVLGNERAAELSRSARSLLDYIGDGMVPVAAGGLEGVTDTVIIDADHRTMIRRWDWQRKMDRARGREPEQARAIPIILDRLGDDGAESPPATP